MAKTPEKRGVSAKRPFRLGRAQVERAMNGILPEPIARHYVVIGHRRYPPKQVIGELTGLDRADFTSHQARRVLMNLGFGVGRKPRQRPASAVRGRVARAVSAPEETTGQARLAETLRELPGQWVATRGDELLVAAATPYAVVSWLAQHHQKADSLFRVPEDELAASGLAPL